MTKTAKQEKPNFYKIHPGRHKQAEFERVEHRVYPEVRHSVEDLLRPEYWAHIAPRFTSGDMIEAVWEDSSRYAQLYVLRAELDLVSVALLYKVDLAKTPSTRDFSEEEFYEVKWKGPLHKFTVVRKSDGKELAKEFKTKHEAEEFIVDYKKDLKK